MTRKLDALVAQHVMGWHVYYSEGEFVTMDGISINDWRGREGEGNYRDWVPLYSSDLSCAEDVIDEFPRFHLHKQGVVTSYKTQIFTENKWFTSDHTNLCTSICEVALLARGVSRDLINETGLVNP